MVKTIEQLRSDIAAIRTLVDQVDDRTGPVAQVVLVLTNLATTLGDLITVLESLDAKVGLEPTGPIDLT